MSMPQGRRAIPTVELLKLLRAGWHTRRQIRAHMGWCEVTVDGWVRELESNGMVRTTLAPRLPGHRGRKPTAYTLAPEWGGRDHPVPQEDDE